MSPRANADQAATEARAAPAGPAQDAEGEQCWICLDDASEDGSRQLLSPCKCPRKVHPQCLARWQLQQAGRHEERFCRWGPGAATGRVERGQPGGLGAAPVLQLLALAACQARTAVAQGAVLRPRAVAS
jgi:hypothetical protein